MRTDMQPCSICGGPLCDEDAEWKGGNNAAPINDGRCCDWCNSTVVVPVRIKMIMNEKSARETRQ